MDLDFEYHEVINEAVLEHAKTDTFSYELKIAFSADNHPKFYYTHLITPVCETGACHLVTIEVYWDLVGNYLAYDLPRKRILTKIDHQHFTEEDYAKLHSILADPIWPLADYPIDQLIVDSTKVLVDSEVDGYSGATAPFVTEENNIKGALYTIYTLWEFAHDEEIITRLQDHTLLLVGQDKLFLTDLLKSDNESYWEWAVALLYPTDIDEETQPLLITILKKCDPFLGYEILALLDGSSEAVQMKLWEIFKVSSIEKKRDIKEKLAQYTLSNKLISKIDEYAGTVKNPLEKFVISGIVK